MMETLENGSKRPVQLARHGQERKEKKKQNKNKLKIIRKDRADSRRQWVILL